MGYIHPLTRCSLVREGVLETLPGMKVNVFLFSLRQACSAGSEEASRDKGLGGGGQQRRGVHRRGIGCEGRCGGSSCVKQESEFFPQTVIIKVQIKGLPQCLTYDRHLVSVIK